MKQPKGGFFLFSFLFFFFFFVFQFLNPLGRVRSEVQWCRVEEALEDSTFNRCHTSQSWLKRRTSIGGISIRQEYWHSKMKDKLRTHQSRLEGQYQTGRVILMQSVATMEIFSCEPAGRFVV